MQQSVSNARKSGGKPALRSAIKYRFPLRVARFRAKFDQARILFFPKTRLKHGISKNECCVFAIVPVEARRLPKAVLA